MRAVYLTGHGGNEVVAIGARPAPALRPGHAVIRVAASGLNRVDLYMRDSGAGITHAIPQVMGLDAAGTIEAIDGPAPGLTVGQKVVVHPGLGCGRCEFCRRGEHVLCTSMKFLGEHCDGTWSDFVCVPVENVLAQPDTLDAAEAAALSVSYLTAFRMVFTKARVQPWETVLIIGIGGTVSLAALQLVTGLGGRAIVTSRDAGKLARAEALGADGVINSSREDIARAALAMTGGRGVDVVIENVGEAVWSAALKALVRGGRIVTCGATSGDAPSADLRRLFIRQLQVLGSTHGTFEEFRALLDLAARGVLKPVIDTRYPLAEAHRALDHLESGRQFGKIALEL